MGRFSEWSSLSFNVTITNFFGTIERFGIILTSLQQNSHSDWQLLKLGEKGKKQFNWSSLENHFFVDRGRSFFFPWVRATPLAPNVCSVLSVHFKFIQNRSKNRFWGKRTTIYYRIVNLTLIYIAIGQANGKCNTIYHKITIIHTHTLCGSPMHTPTKNSKNYPPGGKCIFDNE